jgi:hypothetical protein
MCHITFRVYGKCGHRRVNFSIRIADIRVGSETPYVLLYIIFFSNLLIGWQLSICICCKLFFSLLYNCPLLFSWRLALSIVVEVFP